MFASNKVGKSQPPERWTCWLGVRINLILIDCPNRDVFEWILSVKRCFKSYYIGICIPLMLKLVKYIVGGTLAPDKFWKFICDAMKLKNNLTIFHLYLTVLTWKALSKLDLQSLSLFILILHRSLQVTFSSNFLRYAPRRTEVEQCSLLFCSILPDVDGPLLALNITHLPFLVLNNKS